MTVAQAVAKCFPKSFQRQIESQYKRLSVDTQLQKEFADAVELEFDKQRAQFVALRHASESAQEDNDAGGTVESSNCSMMASQRNSDNHGHPVIASTEKCLLQDENSNDAETSTSVVQEINTSAMVLRPRGATNASNPVVPRHSSVHINESTDTETRVTPAPHPRQTTSEMDTSTGAAEVIVSTTANDTIKSGKKRARKAHSGNNTAEQSPTSEDVVKYKAITRHAKEMREISPLSVKARVEAENDLQLLLHLIENNAFTVESSGEKHQSDVWLENLTANKSEAEIKLKARQCQIEYRKTKELAHRAWIIEAVQCMKSLSNKEDVEEILSLFGNMVSYRAQCLKYGERALELHNICKQQIYRVNERFLAQMDETTFCELKRTMIVKKNKAFLNHTSTVTERITS